jgi:hypothetical protein
MLTHQGVFQANVNPLITWQSFLIYTSSLGISNTQSGSSYTFTANGRSSVLSVNSQPSNYGLLNTFLSGLAVAISGFFSVDLNIFFAKSGYPVTVPPSALVNVQY